jgi:ABC-type Zn uptake system ZnuABC Zn-binding protein ZnuA
MFARQIADETGVRVVTDLHLESLTDGAPAATYLDMMKHNVTRIVEALK